MRVEDTIIKKDGSVEKNTYWCTGYGRIKGNDKNASFRGTSAEKLTRTFIAADKILFIDRSIAYRDFLIEKLKDITEFDINSKSKTKKDFFEKEFDEISNYAPPNAINDTNYNDKYYIRARNFYKKTSFA